MTNLVNTTLGKYTLLAQIGEGGMGAVYRSVHPQLHRPVAIKVILGNATAETRNRFLREAQMAIQLSHPHVVRVYDVDEDNGILYIVMELIEGQSLSAVLRQGRMPLEQVLRIGTELATALDYAHSHGVVHRDLKPGNVLLRPNGSTVLVDFGLARLAGSASGEQLTQSGMVIGTLAYMAPEQIQAQALDGRTDIYALGVLLFQMITGRLPFEGDTAQMLFSHVYNQPPAPSTTGALLPPALDSLIVAMLAKHPASRPQRAAEVADVLKAISANAATPPAYAAYTGPTAAQPQPTQFAAYQGYPTQPPLAGTPSGGYAPPAPRRFSPVLLVALLSFLLIGGLGYYVISSGINQPNQPTTQSGARIVITNPTDLVLPRPTEFGGGLPQTTAVSVIVPSPTVAEAEKWTVANVRDRVLPGGSNTTFFNGTLVNDGPSPREGVQITVVLRDKDDKELDSENGYVSLHYLAPGQKTGWSVIFSRNLPPYDHVDVEVRSKKADFGLGYSYRDLRIDEPTELIEDFFPIIRGTVTNTGQKRAKFVQIYAIVYDQDGNVLSFSSGFAEDDVVLPGVTSRFEISILVTAQGGKPASYELFVEGTEDTEQ